MAGDANQNKWKDGLKARFPQYFKNIRVADIGSADINGTNKPWFENCEYVGLDIAEAKNVDVISIAHEYDAPDESFDVVCSTSELEHDIHWAKTLRKMVKLLKPNGLMWFEAPHVWSVHGTRDNNPTDSLTSKLEGEWGSYYRNLSKEDIESAVELPVYFDEYELFYAPHLPNPEVSLRFWGIKKPYRVKTYWDTFVTSYQMGFQKHRIYALDLFKEKGVESLLDVGAGTGPIYGMIKDSDGRWTFKYKGIDYSNSMIVVAKKSYPEAEWAVGDARKLEEPDNSWDCVFLMHCLDHLDNYQAAIKEATRVSKKYVCIILWRSFVLSGTNLNDKNMFGKQEDEKPWEDTFLQEYSREALDVEFEKNGLVVEHEVSGEAINSDESHWNWLCLLKKK